MKKYILPYSILLLFIFIASCKGQKNTDLQSKVNKERPISKIQKPKTTSTKIQKSKTKNTDYDTYFVESDSITSTKGPTNITRNILQDRKGNIWLATWEGIMRYDGKTFTNFTNKDSLRRFHVFSLLEDSKGHLWFGTIGAGVYHYDGKKFTNFTTEDGLANNQIGCFMEDSNGIIWIGTMGGISRYDGTTFHNFTKEDGLSDNDINSIVEDKNGKIWIGARGYACTYDGKTFTKLTYRDGLPFVNVRSIIEDQKGKIWIGGDNGLWRYDGKSYANFVKNFVGYIHEDSKGNIWTSSAVDGNAQQWVLTRYEFSLPPMEHMKINEISQKTDMFFGILEDKDGGIWLGTLNGVGRYDGTSFNFFRD